MRTAFFSTKPYDQRSFTDANGSHGHDLTFLEPRLSKATAVLAAGFPAVCVFVNDEVGPEVIQTMVAGGTRLIALRSAGFNHVDLAAAERAGVTVVRVPAYSPYAVAEFTVALILALNRRLYRAYTRVREGNFALEGLLGFDLRGRTVGIVGTGKIGAVVARIMAGFGCRVLAVDKTPSPECEGLGVSYVPLPELLESADIVTLHCPLFPETYHMIDAAAIARMKPGVMLINTSRGALVDAAAVIEGLKSGVIGHLGLDVYEEEADLFFQDLSDRVIQDDVFARLLTFPNVLITGHQAFFTAEAVHAIAETTLSNISAFERGERSGNEVTRELVRPAALKSSQGEGEQGSR
jgi:D-lactate dehydrogenase